MRQIAARDRPRLRPVLLCLCLGFGAVLLAGCGSGGAHPTSSTTAVASGRSASGIGPAHTPAAPPALGFENVPLEPGPELAPASTTGTAPVHGITCGSAEQLAYHIHVHLSVFVNAQPRAIPGGIGIPGSATQPSAKGPVAAGGACIYWLHTHAPDGVIHIESPYPRTLTLGDFFDVWRQPLGPATVAGAHGSVTAWVDGHRWTGNPRLIPLRPRSVVQLDVGAAQPPFQPLDWSATGL